MTVAGITRTCATNETRPGGNRGATVTEPAGGLGLEKEPNASFSHSPDRRVNGAVTMAHLYALPAELAQPVARGHLPLAHAYAAMLADTVRAERLGELAPYKAPDVFRLQKHLLGLRLDAEDRRRALTEGRIVRIIKPMIAVHRPSNAVLAEAHGVNGAAGFPLTEDEVTDIVRTEMYWSLPIGGRRHVG